jgi:hypothetical protein
MYAIVIILCATLLCIFAMGWVVANARLYENW